MRNKSVSLTNLPVVFAGMLHWSLCCYVLDDLTCGVYLHLSSHDQYTKQWVSHMMNAVGSNTCECLHALTLTKLALM